MGESLIISYRAASAEAARDVWLQAEQANVPGDGRLTWSQLQQMLRYARSRISATSAIADICKVEIEADVVRVILKVNVYPSELGLNYWLEPLAGTVDDEVRYITVDRELDLVFAMDSTASAGELLIEEDSLVYYWASPCFDSGYNLIAAPPAIEYAAGRFVVDRKLFGIARVTAKQPGWQHDIVMELERIAGTKYSDITNAVQIYWRDENNILCNTTIDLKLPPCLGQLLDYCSSGKTLASIGPKDPTVKQVTAWVSECSGELLLTIVKEPDKEPVVIDVG